jgi:hypothetical protein
MCGGIAMFVFNLKFSKKKLVAIVTAIVAIVAVMLTVLAFVGDVKVPDSATCDELASYSLVAETVGGECGFLAQFGLDAQADSRESEQVVIPSEFNSIYEDYNALQKKIGLDLGNFKGKNVEKVRYTLQNSDEKFAVLLIYNGRVIGGHLTNGEYGDENLPLI